MSNSTENPGIQHLIEVVARLRSDDGCPWDKEQTLHTLKQYLIEESYEVLDALDNGDAEDHKEELGDVLLQVALHAQIRSEEKEFDFNDVAEGIAQKLIRRHPHVFGDAKADTSDAVLKNWEIIKSKENDDPNRSIVDGIPKHLPALQKAQRIQSRVARVGFDWENVKDVINKIREELGELEEAMSEGNKDNLVEETGDLLFSIVNFCRYNDILAEEALNKTNSKFMNRFRALEVQVKEQGRELTDCSLVELEEIWNQVKVVERQERKH